jgi:hypothetical protein
MALGVFGQMRVLFFLKINKKQARPRKKGIPTCVEMPFQYFDNQ